jgi:hypothetical protein
VNPDTRSTGERTPAIGSRTQYILQGKVKCRLAKAEIPLFGAALLARRCKKSLQPRHAPSPISRLHDLFCFSALITWDYSILGGKTLGANLPGYQSNQPMIVETWRFDFLHLDISRGVRLLWADLSDK